MRMWLVAAVAAFLLVSIGGAQAQPTHDGPAVVGVGIHLINFGTYDTAKGTYVMDAYLHFVYPSVGNITPEHFEFMNGRATSRDLLSDDVDANGIHDTWYRVQANLYSQPDFTKYPFDAQRLTMVLEDTIHPTTELTYVLLDGNTTIDSDVHVGGWNIDSWDGHVGTKDYPFGESYSRITYTLHVSRERLSSGLRTFLPPIAFMIVASFSFFFDRTQAANRLGLGTGMLITAVGFHISQTVGLPALGALSLFDQVMISVYTFIAATILVTTVLAFGERLHIPERASKLINRRGAILAVLAPVVVFLLLRLL